MLRRFNVFLLTIISIYSGTCWGNETDAVKHITFGCTIHRSSPTFKLLDSLYRTIFSELGYSFSMEHQPDMRSIAEVSLGNVDGHCGMATPSIENFVSTEVRVINPSIGIIQLYAIGRKGHIDVDNLTSLEKLKSNNYNIISIRGGSTSHLLTINNIPHESVTNADMALKMILGHRKDVLVVAGISIVDIIESTNSRSHIVTGPPLLEFEVHTLLNRKHEILSFEFESILLRLLQEIGTKITIENHKDWTNFLENYDGETII